MTIKSRIFATLLAAVVLAMPAATVQGAPVCGTWEPVEGPATSDGNASLFAVVAADASKAWAVGTIRKDGVANPSPLVVRWNGADWAVEPLPDLGYLGTGIALEGISLADGTPMAAGHYRDASGTSTPLVLQMRNGHWQAEEVVMATAAKSALFHDVDASALAFGGEAFAVGEATGDAGMAPFAARYDGSVWRETPLMRTTGRLVAVAVAGPNDVWAVGHDVARPQLAAEITHASIYRWNGKGWVPVRHPGGRPGTILTDIVAITNKDVWAIGRDGVNGLFLHYDGISWKEFASPAEADPLSVAAVATDNVWAVGAKAHYHFDGKTWTAYPAGIKPLESERRAIAVFGPCGMWTVGSYVDGGRSFPLFERLKGSNSPEPPSAPAGVTAIVAAHDRAVVEWPAVTGDVTGLVVERCVGESFACALGRADAFVPVAKLVASETSYTDAPLKAETYYTYRVRAYNDAGVSEPSNDATILTPAQEPSSPGPVPQGPTTDPAEPGPVPVPQSPESEPAPVPVPQSPESEPGPAVPQSPESEPGPVPVPHSPEPEPGPVPAPTSPETVPVPVPAPTSPETVPVPVPAPTSPGPVRETVPTPGPLPAPNPGPVPVPAPVPGPSDPGPVPTPQLPAPGPSGETDPRCAAAVVDIVVSPGPRESRGDVQLEVVAANADGKPVDVEGCLPVKWALDSAAGELEVGKTTRYAILHAKPGTYDVRVLAVNGVGTKASISIK